MDLTSKLTIKKILKKHKMRPSKHLGQYFLINKKVRELIIESANLTKKDTVIEIGPGIGTLTQELAKKAGSAYACASADKKVIAVEKDERMCQILKETLKGYKNVKIINQDVLKLSFNKLVETKLQRSYKVVANLPYYITSPVIRKFLEADFPPKEMVLLVQKEVAQRICAKPGKMSILAVAVQFYSRPKIVKIVTKKAFWPIPKVDSAIVKITQIHTDMNTNTHKFFKVVKAGFSSPRKQLANNLADKLNLDKEKIKKALKKVKINLQARAQELGVEDWKRLTQPLFLRK